MISSGHSDSTQATDTPSSATSEEVIAVASEPVMQAEISLEPSVAPTHDAANSLVKSYVIGAMGAGLVPVPAFDLLALVSLQLKMVHSLCGHYGVAFNKGLVRSLVTTLVSSALPVTLTAVASSTLKLIPGFGTLAGGASVAALSGAITYGVGQVFIRHFENGGTLEDFQPIEYRNLFKRSVKEGEQVADDLGEDSAE